MRAKKTPRVVLRTVLLVGEGDAEVSFLTHIKCLYVARGCGVALTIKNARGKGAPNVVDVAIRQSGNAAFDVKAALLDTDADWNDRTRNIARKAKVQVVASEPCLEAMLLALHGDKTQGRSSAQCKQTFVARFGVPAHDATVYAKHFGLEFLQKTRTESPQLQQLLALLNPAKKD